MNKNRIIIVPRTVTSAIAKEFGYARMTIWKSLKGKSDTKVAKLIRAAALQRGGKYLED